MHLTRLRLQNFRNHINSLLEFCDGINAFIGDNGQGKTNIIEAISYLCLTKSFYAAGDVVVININQEMFGVEGTFVAETGTISDVRVAYDRQLAQKAFFINRKIVEPFSSVVGKFPVVICSPEHAPITSGSPNERRKFVDFVVSQSNPLYFKTLIEYRRVLKQRNKILFESKIAGNNPAALLDPWEEQIVILGAELMKRRENFVHEFQSYVQSSYRRLVNSGEEPSMQYVPNVENEQESGTSDYIDLLRRGIHSRRVEEIRFGTTLVGPHRDEFLCTINGLDMRKFASQGQHKTFLVALKLAEFHYLKEQCGETPLLLLDDVFSELDRHRSDKLLVFVENMGQAFVTSTTHEGLERIIELSGFHKKFVVRDGCVFDQKVMVPS